MSHFLILEKTALCVQRANNMITGSGRNCPTYFENARLHIDMRDRLAAGLLEFPLSNRKLMHLLLAVSIILKSFESA